VKHILRALLVSFLVMLTVTQALAYELPKPKLLIVYFTADWCPNCKILSPILAEARSKGALDDKDVLFVDMNLTDKPSIHQSILLASALGIAPFVQKQGSATGYVALLAADKTTELARFDRSATAAEMIASVEKHLAAGAKK
jgi:thiol-disulfide isomerase/thioredoxin